MSIKSQTISGVKWTSVSTVSLAVTQLLKISILARFLDKTDFGLIAIVMVVLGFTNLFVDMGITSAILHKQKISQKEYSSLYWLNFIFSIVFFSIIVIVTPQVAIFYSNPELNALIPIMSTTLIISAFGKQFKIIEQKDLNFKFISLVDIICSIVSLVAAVILAIYDFGVYSLVYSVVLMQILSNILFFIYGIKKTTISIHFSFSEVKSFLKIGIYQVGGQVVNYFNRDMDIILVGKFFGAEVLGGYSLAKQLVNRPVQIINPILTKVASPVLAKFQDNQNNLKTSYLKLINIVSSLNFVIYLGILVFAKYIVIVLYGHQYDEIVILVKILSVFMYFRSFGNPAGSLIIATGKTHLGFYWNLFVLFVMPAVIYIACQYSIIAVAFSISATTIILIIPAWYFTISRMIKVSIKEYLLHLVPSYKEIISFRNTSSNNDEA